MFIFIFLKFILEAGRSSFALNNSRDHFSQVANVSDALCWGYSVPEPLNTGDKFVLVVWFHYGMQEALKFVPEQLDRIHVGALGRSRPVVYVVLSYELHC